MSSQEGQALGGNMNSLLEMMASSILQKSTADVLFAEHKENVKVVCKASIRHIVCYTL